MSYNAWEFLSLTLHSVSKAVDHLNAEIIVVDNASSTPIVDNIRATYKQVTVIANSENLGFAKANNLGLKTAKGRVVVIVNPDIIVGENTFDIVLDFYANNTKTGGLGFRMFNGQGYYLKESKRGLPTPLVSFYKLSGLASLFPKSKKFSKYYHGEFSEQGNHTVDILTGAFLAQQRQDNGLLELLDERYFMYGEDIDLSYALSQNCGPNYFIGDSPIIHFKGRSTPRKAFIYRSFYHSMWLFYEKYFKASNSSIINVAIYLAIKSIQNIKIATLPLYRKKTKTSKASFDSITILSGREELIKKVGSVCQSSKIILEKKCPQEIGISELIVFDLVENTYRNVIHCMDKIGAANYAISSPCSKFIVVSQIEASGDMVHYY